MFSVGPHHNDVDPKNEFVKAIVTTLKIEPSVFALGSIEIQIESIKNENLLQLFQYAMAVEAYGNGLKALAIAVQKLKNEKKEELFSKTRVLAEAMYTKFLDQSCQMFDYVRLNRGLNPNDREFFCGQKYENLKNIKGEKVFTAKELYVLKALGAGEFMMNISYYLSRKDVTDKIENVIKNSIAQKYLLSAPKKTTKNEEIEIYNQSVIGLLEPQRMGGLR